jgi:plasmid stability protein
MNPNIRYGADMPNISVKDVPEAWAEALRQRAARNHRSLQGELMAIIEQAAQESLVSPAGTQTAARRPGASATRRGSKTIEQIYAEHLVRFPEPITQGPLSVDIIRQDRDSR